MFETLSVTSATIYRSHCIARRYRSVFSFGFLNFPVHIIIVQLYDYITQTLEKQTYARSLNRTGKLKDHALETRRNICVTYLFSN